jgi:hypothetical protein
MQTALYLLVLSFFLAGALEAKAQDTMSGQGQQTITDEELMARLKGAAPEGVLAHATIMNKNSEGKMKVIRQGNNGWTCMDPGHSPMCADAAAMDWVHAMKSKGPAPQKIGFIYMLKGDGGTSNTDPYATGKTPDNNWVETGPHVMIVGPAKDMLQAYPRDAKADPTKPYVMWPGTPYEHLMLPTE